MPVCHLISMKSLLHLMVKTQADPIRFQAWTFESNWKRMKAAFSLELNQELWNSLPELGN